VRHRAALSSLSSILTPLLAWSSLLAQGAAVPGLPPQSAPATQPSPLDRVGFEGSLKVELAPVERYYYPGQPVEVRATFQNTSGQFMKVIPELLDPARLKVQDGRGTPLASAAHARLATQPEGPPPEEIFPRRSLDRVYRLSDRFPGLGKLGKYTVVWEHPKVASAATLVQVIRTYDARREYVAEVRTNMGRFSIEFFPSVAPNNVKNFIDLANSGYYDGLQFHQVIPGILIQAGDRKGDGTGYPGYRVPPEFSQIHHLKGTVSMWHHPSTVDSGSQFFIMLSDQSQFDGHYTVIGQVKEGMDVVEKINQVPTTEDHGRMPFRPLQSVLIEEVRVKGR
jgi:cyclophilin family peptidyl-prolyl cis-trans isomerase